MLHEITPKYLQLHRFMRIHLCALCIILFCSPDSYAQYDNICDLAYADFNNLINAFLQLPTEKTRNEEIYNRLNELQNAINDIHVSQEERYQLNSLQADINVAIEFMSPISNKAPSHLSNDNFKRLQSIFGINFTQTKLNIKCPNDEVQFIEVRIGSLIICYSHCLSQKSPNGLRIKFYAASGNDASHGEYGTMKNEYVPILHNAGHPYVKLISATIVDRF